MTGGEATIDRYVRHDEIASGGMGRVHLGQMLGEGGFARTVAIKCMHAHHTSDPDLVAMFMDEARLAACVHHPNVVATLDVVRRDREVFIVMEYVAGESLSKLLAGGAPPLPVIAAVVTDLLSGLHAAHEARSASGAPLGIVHRDVSPQNVVVGLDGCARVLDFGVAKAVSRAQSTRDGKLKGKLRYMSPEQLRHASLDRRSDVFAASVVLWEALAGRALFDGDDPATIVRQIIEGASTPPSSLAEGIPPELDALVLRGLARDPAERFATAAEMAEGLEAIVPLATRREVGRWVERLAGATLASRAARIDAMDRSLSGASVDPARDIVTTQEPPPATPTIAPGTPPATTAAARPATSPDDRPASSTTWRQTAIGGVAALIALTGAGAVALAWSSAGHDEEESSHAARASRGEPEAPREPVLSEGEPPTPAPVVPPEAESDGAASEGAPRHRPRSFATAPVPPRALRVKAPAARCDPPFVMEAAGIKRFKPECL